MNFGPQFEENLDISNISSELLLLTLEACNAGLFYSPVMVAEIEKIPEYTHSYNHDPNQAWSLNVGPLIACEEPLKDASELINYIVDSDVPNLLECVNTAFNEKKRESNCEYRINRPDGEIRWMHSRILIGFTEEGELRYLASMLFDITEQKHEQEKLEQSNLQLEQAQCLYSYRLR